MKDVEKERDLQRKREDCIEYVEEKDDKHVVRTWLMQEQIRFGGEPRNCLV